MINAAVGPKPGIVSFFECYPYEYSSIDEARVRSLEAMGVLVVLSQIRVEVKLLSEITSNLEQIPHFLTLDVEGLDDEILDSIDFESWRPKIICTEKSSPALREQGYVQVAQTPGSVIFLDADLAST